MSRRFFCEEPIEGPLAKLVGQQAHHLQHVLRAKVGDEVTLFDGQGDEFTAAVQQIGRSEIELTVIQRHQANREAVTSLTLAVSLPKGDRQKWLVEKCTELGVACLIPLQTERGVAQPTTSALQRLRRSVIGASKQCGRNRLMRIESPQSIADLKPTARSLIAHPNAALRSEADTTHPPDNAPAIIVAIGPEGGFTDDEVAAKVNAGWQTFSLGPRILRIETAAIAVASRVLLPNID